MALPKRTGEPRRGLTVPPGGYLQIRRLALQGAREGAIARKLGFSPATWTRLKDRDPKALDAYQRGRDELEAILIHRVREPKLPADAGLSVSERIAVMKARQFGALSLGNSLFGWSQPATAESERVSVTITLPAALPAADYAKAIEGVAVTKGQADE